MPDDGATAPIDPWRVAADLTADAERAQAARPELAARLRSATAPFSTGGTSTADLLDELGRHTTIDATAPLASSRPVVGALKGSVRKATHFITRHLAQQVTVVNTGLVAALHAVDRRVTALERGIDPTAAAALVPALPSEVEAPLAAVIVPGARVRRVDTWLELITLPPGDTDVIVITSLGEVVDAVRREELLDRAVTSLRPGGWLGVISHAPGSWARVAGPVVADLAPGRPLHPETWCHLFELRGATVTESHGTGDAYVALGRW